MPVVHTQEKSPNTLTGSLMHVVRYYNKTMSADTLLHGLPLEGGQLTPALMVRAAKRAGLKCGIVTRPLAEISPHTLPSVLFLKNRTACVLLSKGEKGIQVFFPVIDRLESFATEEEFLNRFPYSGHAALFKDEGAGVAVVGGPEAEDRGAHGEASWFWGTIKQFKGLYVQVGLAAVFINFMALVAPLFVMNVYDRVVPNAAFDTLWVLALGAVCAYVFDFIIRLLRGYFIDVAGKGADIMLAGRIFQQVLNIRLGTQVSSSGAFANQLREYESLREFFTSATLATLVDLPFILLFVLMIAVIGGPLALVPLIAIPIVLLVSYMVQKPLQGIVAEASDQLDGKHGHLVETLNGMETIKSLNAQGRVQKKWEGYVGAVARVGAKSRFLSSIGLTFTTFAQQLVTVFLIVFGVYLISEGSLSMGALIASTMLVGRALAPLSSAVSLYSRFQQSKRALMNLNSIMQLETERPIGKNFLQHDDVKGDIKFVQTSFLYPNAPLKSVSGIDLHIKQGEKVAIVGRTGSGKSTLLRLMQGLFAPGAGAVLLDDLDLRQLDPAEYRAHIGYVPQSLALFSGTLRENVLMGSPFASGSELTSVLKRYAVTDFTSRHPQGVDLPVGEGGGALSGGQRQLIAIARAMIKNPSVLLLDEPTSELDNATEMQVIHALKEDVKDKTLVVVTHKFSMLELVDRVIVLDYGKVLMDGPKNAVLKQLKAGKY